LARASHPARIAADAGLNRFAQKIENQIALIYESLKKKYK